MRDNITNINQRRNAQRWNGAALAGGMLAIGAIAALLLTHTAPKLLIERTSSMSPQIAPGDLVVAEPVTPMNPPRVGEIASYQLGPYLITHRIVGMTADGRYLFKGDANPTRDPWPVAASQVRAVYLADVPHMGALIESVTTTWGKLATILSAIVIAGASLAWRRRPRRAAAIAPLPLARRKQDAPVRRAA